MTNQRSNGQLLYGDPTDYEDFKAVARRMYDDAEPLFALERVLIKKRQQHLNKITAKYA